MRAQVAIIGGGPAGLLLSQILHRNDIDSVVLEKKSRAYVMRRIRAGVLEWGSVQVLRNAGVGERMLAEGRQHNGTAIVWSGSKHLWIDTRRFTGKKMMAYGQTAITGDLYAARDRMGGTVIDKVESVGIHAVDTDAPYVTFDKDGESQRLDCKFVAGCDGFHGISRKTIPRDIVRTYKKTYPFGWLGILSETSPIDEIVYAIHERGFALASQRGPKLRKV